MESFKLFTAKLTAFVESLKGERRLAKAYEIDNLTAARSGSAEHMVTALQRMSADQVPTMLAQVTKSRILIIDAVEASVDTITCAMPDAGIGALAE